MTKKEIEERAKKFAKRVYTNSDGEAVASIVDEEVRVNAMIVALQMREDMTNEACKYYCENLCEKGRVGMCYCKDDTDANTKLVAIKDCDILTGMRQKLMEGD